MHIGNILAFLTKISLEEWQQTMDDHTKILGFQLFCKVAYFLQQIYLLPYIVLVFYPEGRQGMLARWKAGTKLKELEVEKKESEVEEKKIKNEKMKLENEKIKMNIRYDRASKDIDLDKKIERIKNPQKRENMRGRLASYMSEVHTR